MESVLHSVVVSVPVAPFVVSRILAKHHQEKKMRGELLAMVNLVVDHVLPFNEESVIVELPVDSLTTQSVGEPSQISRLGWAVQAHPVEVPVMPGREANVIEVPHANSVMEILVSTL